MTPLGLALIAAGIVAVLAAIRGQSIAEIIGTTLGRPGE